MVEIIIAIGLSGQAFYSLSQKPHYFMRFDSWLFLIATIFYVFIAFQKFEWYVPLLGVMAGGTVAAWLQFGIYLIVPDSSNFIKNSSIIEMIYSAIALIIFLNNFN